MAAGAVVETVAESVADELELASIATRRIDGKVLSSVLMTAGVGLAVGFYIGYRYSRKKLRNEIYAEAEEDIKTIREHYQSKIIAAEHLERPSVEELVKERGYVTAEEAMRPTRPPVPVNEPKVVQFPTEITNAGTSEAEVEISENTTAPGVVSSTRRERTSNVFKMEPAEKDADTGWDYAQELASREGKEIYIIHQDEFLLNESGYSQVTYTYYSVDNVLVDSEDPQNILSNRVELIGDEALKLFGHGSSDHNVVFVRNDELELEFAVNNLAQSWDVEVLGLDPDESG